MDAAISDQFLLDQVPLRYRALIAQAIWDARATAATLAMAEPILQVPSAKDNHGRLISWGVDHGIESLIRSGRWPVACRWCYFAQPTGRYLEIRLAHSVMTISRVPNPTIQPRDVKFRQNARLNNQPSLPLRDFDDTRSVAGLPSFLLIHGGETESAFAHIAVPHPISRDYIYKTPNLMDMVHDASSDLPPVENTDTDAVVDLKDEIEKWRRKNGHE
ncbi:MAG: hypothetical protein U1E66_08520 [Rhodospirillales bacterium]